MKQLEDRILGYGDKTHDLNQSMMHKLITKFKQDTWDLLGSSKYLMHEQQKKSIFHDKGKFPQFGNRDDHTVTGHIIKVHDSERSKYTW